MEFKTGAIIGGNYRVVRPLGSGGMGAVYEVVHTLLGVHYALKVFTFNGDRDALMKNKFLAEGKVLARLNDPRIIRVFDLGFDETTGVPYFVMDLVLSDDGAPRTLLDVETAEIEEESVLRWFGDLAVALDYVHARGIVHRDIKPGNVLLAADGRVRLSDFGVSRLFSEQLRRDVNAENTMVSDATSTTRPVMGTRCYMAPEVARGEPATPAADAYSLGVMFVYLLTGIWYTPGSKVFRVLETLDYRWADVLSRLLADDPADRPTKIAELISLLSPRTNVDSDRETRRNDLGWIVPLVLAFAVAAVLVIMVVVLWWFPNPVAPATPDPFDEAFGVRGIYEEGGA